MAIDIAQIDASPDLLLELPAVQRGGSRVAEMGAAGAARRMPPASRDLLKGAPYIVDYCDPSPTTPLHAGYLRNIALGHALANTLEAAGAHVAQQTQIADAGRDMCEAMAGYLRYAKEMDPATAGEKSDRFVGRLHELHAKDAREDGDLSDSLLGLLSHGDPRIRDLWHTVRDWAVSGQNETLARLGVHFDRAIFDSQYAPRIQPLVRLALAQGVISGSPRGPLVFETDGPTHVHLPLIDAAGLPTKDLRALTIWRSLMTEMTDVTLVRLTSEERRDNLDEILRGLAPGAKVYPTAVLHAEVVADGDVGPGGETALLIDDLLDMLLQSEELSALAIEERAACATQDLAAMVLLGMCLDHPLHEALSITPERVLDGKNAGWTFARAWMKAWDPDNDGGPLPLADDEHYRSVVAQSQLLPLLDRAVKGLDVLRLVRFLERIGSWYLETETDRAVGRIMRSLLSSGLGSLGLVRVQEGE
ncbi:MAG TPA: arginine--tRNA ligase [Solirubrobacteraceae bacterium]|jgi:arginyl-tRNA synthetase|nr:arginine--tRNA ligase [Solirubrobacteraceae bacterium]